MGDFSSAWLKNLILRQKKKGFFVSQASVGQTLGTSMYNFWQENTARAQEFHWRRAGIGAEGGISLSWVLFPIFA